MEMPGQKGTDVPQVPVHTGLRLLGLSLPLVLLPTPQLVSLQDATYFSPRFHGLAIYPLFLYSLCLNLSPMS